ncbi:lipid-A-disaccharide kinase [Lutibacter sp. Hel_I_33_5]|uniref:tetraacyldisaccharide 4'-kinase n=1 Tax=Lutibacter sp. Hel_I_33_5 TaxID=1566289 RepID=UPI00119ED13B|nr:tetraacyldisaccharide 4'-kinase [Lutibacter sp. Hel_I_33_5]TVZ57163.1 lipid-A-disaccharide kinase [Lutibacter sp. Hel_I_33_5]
MKLLRFILFPFAILYDLITSIRNYFYDTKIFKSTTFKTPIIAVGNLNVGGTGKTPQIEYLIRLLQDTFNIAILSRGYKRKTNGFVLVDNNHTADDVGDEPLQYFKKFTKCTVAVDEDRVNGINQLLTKKLDVILLDDAFQHRKVTADCYILLTKYDDLYTDDFLLPTGNLRESKRGAQRATIIIVTKCPENLSETKQQEIIKKLKPISQQKIYFTTISYADKSIGKENINNTTLHEYETVLVTGIANPKPMLRHLSGLNVKFTHLEYPDHYSFKNKDIAEIETAFKSIKSSKKIILTTEKDFMRISNKIDNLYYLPIETKFLNKNTSKFNTHILNYLKK